jgi:hypothetical protein
MSQEAINLLTQEVRTLKQHLKETRECVPDLAILIRQLLALGDDDFIEKMQLTAKVGPLLARLLSRTVYDGSSAAHAIDLTSALIDQSGWSEEEKKMSDQIVRLFRDIAINLDSMSKEEVNEAVAKLLASVEKMDASVGSRAEALKKELLEIMHRVEAKNAERKPKPRFKFDW